MPTVQWRKLVDRFTGKRRVMLCAAIAVPAMLAGTFVSGRMLHDSAPVETGPIESIADPITVNVARPERRTIVRVVGQPSFVESYERTSIFPKVTGYIEKWNVDIGDKVKKDQTLATLFVPELVEDLVTKNRTVTLDKERVSLAKKVVEVAAADVQTAQARLDEANAILAQYEAQVERWDSQVVRLTREEKNGVVDSQVLLETVNQLKASRAARDAAKATIRKAEAELLSKRATLAQDEVDVKVAENVTKVAESDALRMKAWVGYLTLPAPYDGVVVARNANTWDFVMPITGDPSADHNSPHMSPNGQGAPIFVIERTDVVRIFVDVPESDANYVKAGTKATVQIKAFRDRWYPATVTRTSWALNQKSRTLRAEIDLCNGDNPSLYTDLGDHPIAKIPSHNGIQILPGMYAYGKVIIEQPNCWAVPVSALNHSGDSTFCWGYENGHAVKMEVQTGISDGSYIEITSRQVKPKAAGDSAWEPIDGTEQLVLGDSTALAEGTTLRLAGSAAATTDHHNMALAAPAHGEAESKK